MNKKVLSLIICGSVIFSGGMFNPANAACKNVCSSSVIQKIIEEGSYIKDAFKNLSQVIVVDASFKGKEGQNILGVKVFTSVQAAVNSVSDTNNKEVVIVIKKGTYNEKIQISKPNITLIGEGTEKTILTFDAAAGTIVSESDGGDGTATYGTEGCGTVIVTENAVNFACANLTIENAFDEVANSSMKNRQAVALKNDANNSMFVKCRFLGNQDTLYARSNKQYYYDCYIEGDVDFIFGGASAVFEKCEIKSLDRENKNPKGYITAPSTLEENKYGFLILDSKLTSNITEAGTVCLGRPWHPSYEKRPVISSVVYKNCEMGAHISAQGWTTMSGHLPEDNDMYEYGSTGEGAIESESRRVLTDEQASEYVKENVLSGWDSNKMNSKLNNISKASKVLSRF